MTERPDATTIATAIVHTWMRHPRTPIALRIVASPFCLDLLIKLIATIIEQERK